jgi:aryl-alcohol dehydrogenase-like predicted oxidoreductase
MEYSSYGRTQIHCSQLILGTGRGGGTFVEGTANDQLGLITRALDLGLNWLDTARQYGDGKSETNIGRCLPELDEHPVISTKFGIKQEDLSDIPGSIERSVNESLERLGVDHIDIFQTHDFISDEPGPRMLSPDQILGPNGVVEGLEKLKQAGLIRSTGFTAKGQSEAILKIAESGTFDSAQVFYNMLNPRAGQDMPAAWEGQNFDGLIASCRRHRTGVMAVRVFAAGVLATDVRTGHESIQYENADLSTEEARAHAVFNILGDNYGSRAQAAIRFCLANPDIDVVNVGVHDVAQLEEAAKGIALGPLPAEAVEALQPLYAKNFKL